ncbi:MAG: hypothetical protein HY815_26175 [Candidatus Riflebacteria bacterium]|nr:hypothetical protein [Candidatus Riflebacteria bacterium]
MRPESTRQENRRPRAFTLLEVLMAFLSGSILIGIIYFFFFGMYRTSGKALDKMDLNGIAELAIDTLTRDLRMTYTFNEVKPDRLTIQRLPGEEIQSGQGFSVDQLHLKAVEYALVKGEQRAKLVRKEGMADAGKVIFEVDDAAKEIFTAYVLDVPQEKGDQFPRFHVFDTVGQPSGELKRITLVRVSLALKIANDRIHVISKVFLPLAYNNTLQANWNVE